MNVFFKEYISYFFGCDQIKELHYQTTLGITLKYKSHIYQFFYCLFCFVLSCFAWLASRKQQLSSYMLVCQGLTLPHNSKKVLGFNLLVICRDIFSPTHFSFLTLSFFLSFFYQERDLLLSYPFTFWQTGRQKVESVIYKSDGWWLYP